jgi:type III pantothenate kinase
MASPRTTTEGLVLDIGNSRLKAGRVAGGRLGETRSVGLAREEWAAVLRDLDRGGRVAVATVNPAVASSVGEWLGDREVAWFRAAADVPVATRISNPSRAGADRALAVLAAREVLSAGRPGLVVCCGTAITVERIGTDGVWEGGAIGPGPALIARAMNQGTAQLPVVEIGAAEVPAAWGNATEPAVAAGVFWGAVGAARELVDRQRRELGGEVEVIWTGGAAELLSRQIEPGARIVPDLVLKGLARAAFCGPA